MSGLADLKLPEQRSTSERISDDIRQLIIDGSLTPGERVSESKLAARLGISRSPVREALQALVRQRLLVTAPNKTMTVASFTAADVREIYDARQAIETHAGLVLLRRPVEDRRRVRENLQPQLDALAESVGHGDRFAVSKADLTFHTAFVDAAGNGRLLAAYSILSAEALTCINWLELALPSGDELVHDHRGLLDLLVKGNSRALTRAIEGHLDLATSHLLDTRFKPPSPTAAPGTR